MTDENQTKTKANETKNEKPTEDVRILLPEPSLRRLPWYLAYVDILQATGVDTVSSTQISRALNVDASQIAKDLSLLNIKGKTRIGYNTRELAEALSQFLGFRKTHKAFIMGVGSLGAALIADKGLANYGLEIVAGFDVNPKIVGTTISGVKIYHNRELLRLQNELQATIGILAVPADKAQESADFMVAAGLKGIWNFTPYRIRVREGIAMANTSIYAHLALIYNRLATNS